MIKKAIALGFFAVIFLTGFTGCGSMEPKTVKQAQTAVIEVRLGYGVAQRAALVYLKYPRCDAPGALAPFCTKQEVVDAIKRADKLTISILDAAEAAVRAPEFGESQIDAVVTSARAALKLFKDLSDKLPVKPDSKAAPAGDTKLGGILPSIA